jgi:uroporphyrinogen III methyltransferase/synthase
MANADQSPAAARHRMKAARPGTVYLVGAGPGDPSLITVRAWELLASCDAIVHDALVPRELLSGSAQLHFVGKRGGDERSARQEDIHATLIDLARSGKAVVRLKGGDPFVFGRGSEEAEALAAADVPFEVVPGVTAGIAGPAYAGIPVTHRGISTTVTFVTGNEDPAKSGTQVDWSAIARSAGTIVLYMGVQRLPEIAASLTRAGLSADTPAAAIQWATTGEQRTVEGTLATIAGEVRAAGLEAPVVTVIGRVVSLRRTIRWFDRTEIRPLLGRRILVTRPATQASALSDSLRMLGAVVRELPAVRIERLDPGPLREALDRLNEYRHIVFTSPNAVQMVWDVLLCSGRDVRALSGLVVSAIGPATRDALLTRGIIADVTPTRFVAEGLLEALSERADLAERRVLYPAAADARDALPEGLRRLGASVDVVAIYRSAVDADGARQMRAAVASDSVDLVTLASGAAARAYADAVGPDLVARVPGVSIGPVTSQAARAAGIPIAAEARVSTMQGLVDAVVALSAGDTAGVRSSAHPAPARRESGAMIEAPTSERGS